MDWLKIILWNTGRDLLSNNRKAYRILYYAQIKRFTFIWFKEKSDNDSPRLLPNISLSHIRLFTIYFRPHLFTEWVLYSIRSVSTLYTPWISTLSFCRYLLHAVAFQAMWIRPIHNFLSLVTIRIFLHPPINSHKLFKQVSLCLLLSLFSSICLWGVKFSKPSFFVCPWNFIWPFVVLSFVIILFKTTLFLTH